MYAKPLSERHVESDGLVFDPAQITSRTARGVAVPHGNHYHFIPYEQMSELEERIARIIPFVIVQTIGYQIQDQNNQVHNRLRNLVQVRNLHQILNQLQAIQLMRNWSKKLFEK